MPDASYTPHVGTIDSATITLICLRCGLMASERILEKGDRLAVPLWRSPRHHKFEVTISGGFKLGPEVIGVCPQCEVVAEVSIRGGT